MAMAPHHGGMAHRTAAPELVALRDGRCCIVRAIVPGDWRELQALHGRLSPRTRRLRFFSDLRRLPEPMARRFAAIDPATEAAFVALDPGEQAIRAVARYARLGHDRASAEIAVVVEDAYQGVGLGRELLLRLAAQAVAVGIRRFVGSILGENVAMLALLRSLGFAVVERPGLDAIEFELDLVRRAAHPESASANARWMRGRTA